jgi:hypothetical protein
MTTMGFEKAGRRDRMLIGYSGVSTEEQSLDLQLVALKRAGGQRIFTDKVYATNANHPGLADAVSHLRHGGSCWGTAWLPEKLLRISAFRSRRCIAGFPQRVGEPQIRRVSRILAAGGPENGL